MDDSYSQVIDYRSFIHEQARSFWGRIHLFRELSKRLARGLTHEEVAAAVRDRSAGNFLYVDQLLQMLSSSRRIINRSALDALPDGLSKFYRAFLGRVLEPTNRSWEECYRPVLGTLAVEREAMNRQQLADSVDTGKGKIVPVLASVRQLLEVDDNLPASRRSYAFYHRSLADFLLDEDAAEEYWCEEAEQHERITNHYLPKINDNTGDSQDHYGLRNLAFHLAEAAQGRTGLARHHHVETLVDLLCNPTFEQRYQTDCGNPVGWRDESYADQQARLNVEVDQEHDYIGNYIRIHAANNYIRYRNGSLWVIIDSILQHHDQTWVRDRVIDLVTIALAGSRLEYKKNLHLAVLAWQPDKNIPGASSALQRNLIDEALYKAQSSAHRIQDGRFCAQTTARWNALKRRWWDVSFTAPELEETIRAIAADPGEARFAALHHRGENYDLRPKHHPGLFPIPPKVQFATTLAQLADIYERPLAELERINPDDEDSHEWVNVSDPEFAPLLAARLAAETLVIDGLSAIKRVELIQLLIPPAVSHPTVLDTILARLVIAVQRVSVSTLDQLVEIVGVMWLEEGLGR